MLDPADDSPMTASDEVTDLEQLYLQHRNGLVIYAKSVLRDPAQAEDVVQDAWLRIQRLDPAQEIRSPVSFLYRTVHNLCLDGIRRATTKSRVFNPNTEASDVEVSDDQPTPETATSDKEALRLLEAAMAELPERTRKALELRRLGGCTIKQVAAKIGMSESRTHELIAEGIAYCRKRVRREP